MELAGRSLERSARFHDGCVQIPGAAVERGVRPLFEPGGAGTNLRSLRGGREAHGDAAAGGINVAPRDAAEFRRANQPAVGAIENEQVAVLVDAVGSKMPVFVDGGFRRGSDAFKALALGARAVGIGRPYIWGLTAFGQAGVERVLEMMRDELVMTMRGCGVTSIQGLTRDSILRNGARM